MPEPPGCHCNHRNTDLIIAMSWEPRTATGKIKSGLLSRRNVSSVRDQSSYQEPDLNRSVLAPVLCPVSLGTRASAATSLPVAVRCHHGVRARRACASLLWGGGDTGNARPPPPRRRLSGKERKNTPGPADPHTGAPLGPPPALRQARREHLRRPGPGPSLTRRDRRPGPP